MIGVAGPDFRLKAEATEEFCNERSIYFSNAGRTSDSMTIGRAESGTILNGASVSVVTLAAAGSRTVAADTPAGCAPKMFVTRGMAIRSVETSAEFVGMDAEAAVGVESTASRSMGGTPLAIVGAGGFGGAGGST